MLYRHPDASLRTRLAQCVNRKVNTVVGDEDFDLVQNVQAGHRDAAAGSPARCPAARPPSAWFADKIRADLGEDA